MQFRGHSLPMHQSVLAQWTFTLSHIISLNPPTRSLSITGHWNVSLPSGASPWNSILGGRVEGQNITQSPHTSIWPFFLPVTACYVIVNRLMWSLIEFRQLDTTVVLQDGRKKKCLSNTMAQWAKTLRHQELPQLFSSVANNKPACESRKRLPAKKVFVFRSFNL